MALVSPQKMLIRRIRRFRMDLQLTLALFLTAMNKLPASFRLRSHIPALVLLLAILAPMFISVLPAPALSAERQLLADIASSLCAEHGGQQQQGDQNLPADHQCCILCATQGHVLAPANASPIVASALNRLQQPVQQAAVLIILKRAPPLEWASPRGPPTFLSA